MCQSIIDVSFKFNYPSCNKIEKTFHTHYLPVNAKRQTRSKSIYLSYYKSFINSEKDKYGHT